MSEIVKEITVSTSVGGNIQIIKYEASSNYHYSITEKYEGEWTPEEAEEFEIGKIDELRERLDPIAQSEVDELLEQKKENQ